MALFFQYQIVSKTFKFYAVVIISLLYIYFPAQILNSVVERRPGIIYRRADVLLHSTDVKKVSCLGLYPDSVGSWRVNEDIVINGN